MPFIVVGELLDDTTKGRNRNLFRIITQPSIPLTGHWKIASVTRIEGLQIFYHQDALTGFKDGYGPFGKAEANTLLTLFCVHTIQGSSREVDRLSTNIDQFDEFEVRITFKAIGQFSSGWGSVRR